VVLISQFTDLSHALSITLKMRAYSNVFIVLDGYEKLSPKFETKGTKCKKKKKN
jgi:hypothetical protein